jgi:hypothetical protein
VQEFDDIYNNEITKRYAKYELNGYLQEKRLEKEK